MGFAVASDDAGANEEVPNLPMLEALPPTRPLTAVHLTRGVPPPTLISMMSAAYSSLWLADPPAAPAVSLAPSAPHAAPPATPRPGSAAVSPRRPSTSQGRESPRHALTSPRRPATSQGARSVLSSRASSRPSTAGGDRSYQMFEKKVDTLTLTLVLVLALAVALALTLTLTLPLPLTLTLTLTRSTRSWATAARAGRRRAWPRLCRTRRGATSDGS